MMGEVVAGVSLAVWAYLALGHGRFWAPPRLPVAGAPPAVWPAVVAVVPARDEADVLPRTLPTLLTQSYPGPFRVVVVDDDSADGTGEQAAMLGAEVVKSCGPPPGWAGKVAAMAAGVEAAGEPEFLLFTDADIGFPPWALTGLVRAAITHRLDLVSQMVRLRTESVWERLVVPAFVYFFAQLYPFARVNGPGRIAAAAGGCMLVRRSALEAAGGLEGIRAARIDDVALAGLLKQRGRIWLGLAAATESVRAYPRLADLWQMVARSAYVQLRHSPALLAATAIGMLLVYAVPPAAAVAGLVVLDPLLAALGLLAWLTMSATFVPMLRFHRVGAWRAPLLPAVALLYLVMTLDSARRHYAGRGGLWKGRVEPPTLRA